METPSWGPSTCVVLDHLKDGGGEEDAMRFTHTCRGGGQRWNIPPWAASAWELVQTSESGFQKPKTLKTNRYRSYSESFIFNGKLTPPRKPIAQCAYIFILHFYLYFYLVFCLSKHNLHW